MTTEARTKRPDSEAVCSNDNSISESELRELPPSAKLVLLVLEREGVQSQQSLATATRLSRRTVRDATSRLVEAGIVEQRSFVQDARQTIYRLAVDVPVS